MYEFRRLVKHKSVERVHDPVIVVRGLDANFGDIIRVEMGKEMRTGKVIAIEEDLYFVEIFEGTAGLNTSAIVSSTYEPITLPVSELMLGRVFNGIGEPKDDKSKLYSNKGWDVNGLILNPYFRDVPHEMIETGITSLDLLNTLVKGQKLATFASPGLDVLSLQMQILKQSITNSKGRFAVVFAGIGLSKDEEHFILSTIEEAQVADMSVLFLNSAKDPAMEALLTPRMALTAAEYLAHHIGLDVLVIMGDMLNYSNVLRNMASQKGELTVREGYPSYLFTDLASLYERCGTRRGKPGSITQLPFLTMPNDDITHPVPDTTGYISEGQIILTRTVAHAGVHPPIDILNSLSRMMHFAVSDKQAKLSNRVYHVYAEGKKFQDIAAMMGMDVLDEEAKLFVSLKEEIDELLLSQGANENRTLKQSMRIASQIVEKAPSI